MRVVWGENFVIAIVWFAIVDKAEFFREEI